MTSEKGMYYLDFDIHVPSWFKANTEIMAGMYSYYDLMYDVFKKAFNKGNFVIIDTSGGYHVLVKTSSIKANPYDICKEVETIYKNIGLDLNKEKPYLDEKGNCKFECIVNDSQIPGIPLPGTFQYGRPVTVLNKEDFE